MILWRLEAAGVRAGGLGDWTVKDWWLGTWTVEIGICGFGSLKAGTAGRKRR